MRVFRLINWIYGRVPLAESRKQRIKDTIYTNLGPLFRGSDNYAIWRQQQEALLRAPLTRPPSAPTPTQWRAIIERRRGLPTSDRHLEGAPYIVVPVYRGRSETLACLYSVLDADPGCDVVAIDDRSPDSKLVAALKELAAEGLFRLEHNDRNLGFARTVNRGIALHPERDVVLLNSDTQVYGDWLHRLNRLAHHARDVATVTPLSNNADICSYPHTLQDNPTQLEIDYEELDALARVVNDGVFAEAPTAVGFCMYIRRGALDVVGPFDVAFADGYGEENDFCLRASERGWRHLIAGNVFVRHLGEVSFGGRARRLRARALARIKERFPDYQERIDSFIARDPVREIRSRLDAARLMPPPATNESNTRSILFVSHDWGGGVERHMSDLWDALSKEGVEVYCLRPSKSARIGATASLSRSRGAIETPNLAELRLDDHPSELVELLRVLGIGHVHVHHVAGFREAAIADLMRVVEELGCGYDVTLHDFAPICPRLHLSVASGHYCEEPPIVECRDCVQNLGSPFGAVSIDDWRDLWRGILGGARRVHCPTLDVRSRLTRHFPDAAYVVHPHQEHPQASVAGPPRRRPGEPLRVAVPGAINEQKGFELLLACAEDARSRKLPLEFQVVGYTVDDARARRAGVEVSGRYEADAADAVLSESRSHIAFLPALSPETYSFTLSSALRARVFPVVFDLGALAERVGEIGWGEILPCSMIEDAGKINDLLLDLDVPPAPAVLETQWYCDRYASLVEDYYEDFAH
jgi:GT2 family glycosyltransferase/glycosyltransferase involved in cell wall biosynthesis